MTTRRSRVTKKFGVSLVTVGTSLILFECAVRVLPIDRTVISQVSSMARSEPERSQAPLHDRLTGFCLAPPGRRTIHKTSEFKYHYRLNERRLRGPVVPYKKPADEYRIIIIGPSWAYGWGVESDKTVPAILERSLRARYPDRRVRVINAGIPAQWILSNVLYCLCEGLKYDPDAVVHMQAHDFGFQGSADLAKIMEGDSGVFTVDDYFRRLYSKMARVPILGRLQALVFTLERVRRIPAVRKGLQESIAEHVTQSLGETKGNTISKYELVDRSFHAVIDRMSELHSFSSRLDAAVRNASLYIDSAEEHDDQRVSPKVTREFFAGIAEVVKMFQDIMASREVSTIFYNFNGHALFEEPASVRRDRAVSAHARAALRNQEVDHISYDEYLFETLGYDYGDDNVRRLFYAKDQHPNEAGYRLLAEILFAEIVRQDWLSDTSPGGDS